MCVCVCVYMHTAAEQDKMKFERMIETVLRSDGQRGRSYRLSPAPGSALTQQILQAGHCLVAAVLTGCSGALDLDQAWQTELRAAGTRRVFWVPAGCRRDARLHKAHSWSQSRCSDQRITVTGRVWRWRPVVCFLLRSDWTPSQQHQKCFLQTVWHRCHLELHATFIIFICKFDTYTVWALILVNLGL